MIIHLDFAGASGGLGPIQNQSQLVDALLSPDNSTYVQDTMYDLYIAFDTTGSH